MSETKLKRQIVFVSGAYRSKYGIIGRAINIWKAYQVGRRLVRQGYSCYIPHMNTALMDGLQSEDWFLEATLKMLPKCQIIYMMKGWENSEGAIMEFKVAIDRRLKVVYQNGDCSIEHLEQMKNRINKTIGLPDNWRPAIEDCKTVNCKLESEVSSG